MGELYDVYGDRKREDILTDTWGHLKPEINKKYEGWIKVYYSVYGDYGILDFDFPDLQESPWQYEHFGAFVDQFVDQLVDELNSCRDPKERDRLETDQIGVFEYMGYYLSLADDRSAFEKNKWKKIL